MHLQSQNMKNYHQYSDKTKTLPVAHLKALNVEVEAESLYDHRCTFT